MGHNATHNQEHYQWGTIAVGRESADFDSDWVVVSLEYRLEATKLKKPVGCCHSPDRQGYRPSSSKFWS